MPRLTDRNYYKRYIALKHVWEKHELLFAVLSAQQQRDIHSYYRPSTELLDEDCRAHRRQAVKDDPSLPHRASKACILLVNAHNQPAVLSGSHKQRKGQKLERVSINPVMRPEVDWKRYAWATLQYAKELVEKQRQ